MFKLFFTHHRHCRYGLQILVRIVSTAFGLLAVKIEVRLLQEHLADDQTPQLLAFQHDRFSNIHQSVRAVSAPGTALIRAVLQQMEPVEPAVAMSRSNVRIPCAKRRSYS